MTPRLYPVFIALFAITFSCNTTQDIPSDLSTLKLELQMDKNPCFGTCPYYTLKIYQGGIASFEGKRDVDKLGWHVKRLSQKEYDGVKRAFGSSNFFELENDYPSDLVDLPKTAISWYKDGNSKTVTGDDTSRPSIVLGLDKILTQIAESDGWKPKDAQPSGD